MANSFVLMANSFVFRPVAQLAERRSPKPQVGGSIPSWPANYLNIMKETSKSSNKFQDYAIWSGIVLITFAAFFGTYYYNLSAPIKAIIWVSWLVLTFVLSFFSSQGKKAFSFVKESKTELQKVVWPTRQEAVQTTGIVMIMVTIAGFVLWGIDSAMMWGIGKITHLG